ncbi:MAG TPA: hypothetical protein DCY02_00175 [Armatimonadetes bacterium]|nr:hypothetical protein [Armatimonadota bacterium]
MTTMMLALCLLQPPTLSAEKQAAIAEVLKPWRTEDGPGGVVAIYHNGEIVMQEGLGLADLEQGTRLTPESRIDIGSITKQFVVASIVRLELEGKLSQEDSIRKHIPELPEWVEAIKLHHLIHHTSGLRDYLNMSVMSNGGDLNHTPDPDELIEMMKKQRETNFPIGAAAMYCNTGYALLAEVVKRTEKTDLTTATRRLVWEPLGMKDSLYDASADLLVKQRANSYVRNGQGFLAMRLRASIVGDGGMLTTTGDMAKWSRFLATPTEAERPWHEAMLKPSPRPFGPGMRYAGGLFLDKLGTATRIQHGGDWSGFHAMFTVFPETGWSVFTAGNDGTQLSKQMNDQIARILLDLPEPAAPTAPAGSQDWTPLTPEILAAYAGRYVLKPIELPIEFSVEGGKLFALPQGQPKIELTRTGEREFSYAAVQAKFTFDAIAEGKSPAVVLDQGGAKLRGPRGEAFAATAEQRAAWVGEFWSEELEYAIVVTEKEGALQVKINGHDWGAGTLGNAKQLSVGGFLTITPEGRGATWPAIRVDAGGRASRLLFTRR